MACCHFETLPRLLCAGVFMGVVAGKCRKTRKMLPRLPCAGVFMGVGAGKCRKQPENATTTPVCRGIHGSRGRKMPKTAGKCTTTPAYAAIHWGRGRKIPQQWPKEIPFAPEIPLAEIPFAPEKHRKLWNYLARMFLNITFVLDRRMDEGLQSSFFRYNNVIL